MGLRALDANSENGAAYLHDVSYARCFADTSRRAMAAEVRAVLATTDGAALRWESMIATAHNHVASENHGGRSLWVHRKGATGTAWRSRGPARLDGSLSFHVEGRGHPPALCSSAHGAGRALSRTAARGKVTERELRRQMEGIWYDYRMAEKLRDEAPSAYKDIRAVLRAQVELVKVMRTLRPVLNYKCT
jgi:tRNA-splicing ligase RtcB (3'-phosphate/5'-hydroxy nucleic acid ligase)